MVDGTGTPSGAPTPTGTCEAPNYSTIQAAIDAATAGDTVEICAGEYTEDVSVPAQLTLSGPNAGISAGWDAGTRGPEATIVGEMDISAAGTVVDGLEFVRPDVPSTVSPKLIESVGLSGEVTVQNNIVDMALFDVTPTTRGCGAGTWGTAAWRIYDNGFRNQRYASANCSGAGALYNSRMVWAEGAQPIEVDGNNFDNVGQSIFLTGTGPSGSQVTNNTFTALGTAGPFIGVPDGVLIKGNTFAGYGGVYLDSTPNTRIENNLFTAENWFALNADGAHSGTVSTDNAILGAYPAGYGIYTGRTLFNNGANAIDAGDNWWGDLNGAEIAAKLYENPGAVPFAPWIGAYTPDPEKAGQPGFWPTGIEPGATDTFADAAIGDDSNDCLSPTDEGEGIGPCATINAAIGKATVGGTVTVAPGTYSISSPINVNKPLTINGAGKASTTVSTTYAAPSANPAFLVTASDVTLTNMKITNAAQSLSRGIQWASAGSGLTVTNVTFADLDGAARGIVATASLTALNVSGSNFTGSASSVGAYNQSAGIFTDQNLNLSDWTVTDSTFENLFIGTWLQSSMNGLTVTESTFGPFDPSDATSGTASIYIGDLAAGGEVKNVEVTDNDFTDTTRGLYIWNYASGGSIGSVKVKDNSFTDSIFSSAVRVISGGAFGVKMPLEGPVEVEGNTFIQNEKIPGGQGVGMIDFRVSAESATDSVEIKDNTITFTGPFDVTTIGIIVNGSLTNLTISGNTMNGNNAGGTFMDMPPTSGIWLMTNIGQSGPMSDKAKYSIDNNVITGFDDGIAAFDWTTRTYGNIPVGAQVGVTRNDLSGNSGPSIHSGSIGATIEATCNWWGQATGPAAGQAAGDVNTGAGTLRFLQSAGLDSPCLGNPQPTIDPATSFSTVGSLASLQDAGNWDIPEGTGPLTVEYQWEACAFFLCEPGDWVPIPGATDPTYRLTADEVGDSIRAVITASNPGPGGGSASYPALLPTRNPLGPVTPAPASESAPTPTGENVRVILPAIDNGQQVELEFGCEVTEAGTTTVTSRDESQVPGAEGFRFGDPPTAWTIDTTAEYDCEGEEVISVCTTYDVESLPEGVEPRLFHFVESPAPGAWQDVTVSWDPVTGILCGDVNQFSPFAVGRAAVGPENEERPTVSGAAEVGETLTASPGTWTGDEPIDYAYQWQRCEADGSNCSDIGGATGQTYLLTTADSSKAVRVQVTASNDAGSGEATSDVTAQVTEAPANATPPTVSGAAEVGQTLTASSGTWSGFPSPTYAYQWQRSDFASGPWSDLAGATSSTYEVGQDDAGRFLRVAVEASNDAGTAGAESEAVEVAPFIRGFGIRVRKIGTGPVRVPRNRTIRLARVTCVSGGCEITKAQVRVRVRKRLFNGQARYPRGILGEGESAVVRITVPPRAYRTIGRRGARIASLFLRVDAEDGSRLTRAVRIGLRR